MTRLRKARRIFDLFNAAANIAQKIAGAHGRQIAELDVQDAPPSTSIAISARSQTAR